MRVPYTKVRVGFLSTVVERILSGSSKTSMSKKGMASCIFCSELDEGINGIVVLHELIFMY